MKLKALTNRWFMLVLGLIAGVWIGGDLVLRQKLEYDHELEDHYIESRISTILTTTSALTSIEGERMDLMRSNQSLILREAFLTLVELHKTGHYDRKEEKIREYLGRAKEFMAERPDQFLNQEFVTLAPSTDHDNATDEARSQLEAAFDYVDQLPHGSSEHDSGLKGLQP